MKKKTLVITSFFLCLFFLLNSSIYGHERTRVIQMNQDGKKQQYKLGERDWHKEKWYQKNDVILIKIIPEKESKKEKKKCKYKCKCKKNEKPNENWYVLTVDEETLKTSFRDYQGPAKLGEKSSRPQKGENGTKFEIPLSRSGRKYIIGITRYGSWEDAQKKAKGGLPIFKEVFKTYNRYHWAINIGFFIPFSKTDEYELLPSPIKNESQNQNGQDSQNRPDITLTHDQFLQFKTIAYVAIYPFGIEPKRKLSGKYLHKNLHLNIGVEISKNILEKGYLGFGYQIKNLSLDLFYSVGRENVLAPGFEDFIDKTVQGLEKVPYVKKNVNRWGVAISLSFPTAKLFSKVLAL